MLFVNVSAIITPWHKTVTTVFMVMLFFRFLGSSLRIMPVHNPAEAVKLMLTIAKVSSRFFF